MGNSQYLNLMTSNMHKYSQFWIFFLTKWHYLFVDKDFVFRNVWRNPNPKSQMSGEGSVLRLTKCPAKLKNISHTGTLLGYYWLLLFRKGSLRAGAKPRITDSPYIRAYVRVCLDRNRTLNLVDRF